MGRTLVALASVVVLFPIPATAQGKPVLLVNAFTVRQDVPWPYDVKQLQTQTIAELKANDAARRRFDIGAEIPSAGTSHSYALDGEVVSWQAGNRATRLVIGLGAGRETAEIRYWLTDEKHNKVFEHKDTIRAEFFGNAYAGSVGQLAHPFASKIADRLAEMKLSSENVAVSTSTSTAVRNSDSAEQHVLTNRDILTMASAGLSDDVILAKIATSPAAFDTAPEKLIELKKAEVSDRVIEAMIRRPTASAAQTPSPQSNAASTKSEQSLTHGDCPIAERLEQVAGDTLAAKIRAANPGSFQNIDDERLEKIFRADSPCLQQYYRPKSF